MDSSPTKDKIYRDSYQALSKRCLEIQKDNESLVARLQRLKKLASRVERENRMIKKKLDCNVSSLLPNKLKKHGKDTNSSDLLPST